MGKFLRDKDGNFVAIDGGLVLEKTLDRKPRDCESCGFSRWVRKDKIFIIQQQQTQTQQQPQQQQCQTTILSFPPQVRVCDGSMGDGGAVAAFGGGGGGGGGMEWICPDCALQRGLPPEHYHKNFYSTGNERAIKIQAERQRQRKNTTPMMASHQGRTTNNGKASTSEGCDAIWGGVDLTTFMCSHW